MASTNKYENLSQIDYCFRQYFSKYMAPTLVKESTNLRKHQSEEFNNSVNSYVMPSMTVPTAMIATGANLRLSGKWNTKTSDFLIDRCKSIWFKDNKLIGDMNTFLRTFYYELVKQNGGKETPQMQAFALNYVTNRLEGLIVEQLARQKVPRNSAEYIAKKAIEDSLAVLVVEVGPKKGLADEAVAKKAEDLYNPNALEKGMAIGGSMLIDAATTGGYGSGSSLIVKGASKTGIKIGAKTTKFLKSGYSGAMSDGALRVGFGVNSANQWKDEHYQKAESKAVLGDAEAVQKIQEGGNRIKKGDNNYIIVLNSSLNKKVIGKSTTFTVATKQEGNRLYASAHGNAKSLLNTIDNKFRRQLVPYNGNATIPGWMLQKSKDECIRNASAFYSIVMNMSKKQLTSVMAGGKKMSFKEVSQRAYDYARAAVEIEKTSKDTKIESVLKDHWDKNMDELNAQINNTTHTSPPMHTQYPQHESNPQNNRSQGSSSGENNMNTHPQTSGWENAFEQLGLSGFGDVSKNIGYVLAMLPDMLIGMFTGKNQNMKLQDNLMPVAAIIGGLFIRNPLLKMMLLGFGGANLLNTAGKTAINQASSKMENKSIRYKQYTDEPLSNRIEHPVMKGNSMVANIDGRPCVIRLSENAVNAYEQGYIPLNTLANAVLQKYDEHQIQASHNYENQLANEETLSQIRGLK